MISEFLQTGDRDDHRRRKEWVAFKRGPLLAALVVCVIGALVSGALFVYLVVKGI